MLWRLQLFWDLHQKHVCWLRGHVYDIRRTKPFDNGKWNLQAVCKCGHVCMEWKWAWDNYQFDDSGALHSIRFKRRWKL